MCAIRKPSSRTTSTSGRENTNIFAAGNKAPPLIIIFKVKYVWDQWIGNEGISYPNTAYAASVNRWMEVSIFQNYFLRQLDVQDQLS